MAAADKTHKLAYRIAVMKDGEAYALDGAPLSLRKGTEEKFPKGLVLAASKADLTFIDFPGAPEQVRLTYRFTLGDITKKMNGDGELTVKKATLIHSQPLEREATSVEEGVAQPLCGPIMERLTFDQLMRVSEPKRILRADTVRGPALDLTATKDSTYWYFNFKSFPSTTGLRHKGYIRFYKPRGMVDAKEYRRLEDVPCHVDCSCFSGDTKVLMADGAYKPISEIRDGDFVYTHKGRIRRVLGNVARRLKSGEKVYSVKVAGYPDAVKVTGSHPYYAFQESDTFKWVRVEDFRDREWFLSPWFEESNGGSLPAGIARFIGYHVASGSHDKRLSPRLMSLGNSTLREFVIGMFLGDGHLNEFSHFRWTPRSHALVHQVSTILRRLHIDHIIVPVENEHGVSLAVDVHEAGAARTVYSWLQPHMRDVQFESAHARTGEEGLTKEGTLKVLTSREETDFDGEVWDLCVEEDHSFIVAGVAVENCPDYKFMWAWSNKQRGSSAVGPKSLNQAWNKAPKIKNPTGRPGLCKHLLALRNYVYGSAFKIGGGDGDAKSRLDKLVKFAKDRWINFSDHMAKARAREKAYKDQVAALRRDPVRAEPTATNLPDRTKEQAPLPDPAQLGDPAADGLTVPKLPSAEDNDSLFGKLQKHAEKTDQEASDVLRKKTEPPSVKPEPQVVPKGFNSIAAYNHARRIGDSRTYRQHPHILMDTLLEARKTIIALIAEEEAPPTNFGGDEPSGDMTPAPAPLENEEDAEGEETGLEVLKEIRDLMSEIVGQDETDEMVPDEEPPPADDATEEPPPGGDGSELGPDDPADHIPRN